MTRHERQVRWESRRNAIRFWLIRLVFVGGLGAVALVLTTDLLAMFFGGTRIRDLVEKLFTNFPIFGPYLETLTPETLSAKVEKYYLLSRLTIGWLSAILVGGGISTWLTPRLYRPYDDWSFEPIGQPSAEVVSESGDSIAMPWQPPRRGSRLRAWQGLLKAVTADIGTGERPWFRPFARSKVPKPFGYVLLLGRPGAGKSRMAVEIARQLGQRDRLGDKAEKPKANWRQRFGIWLRWRIWFLKRQDDDPWDCGAISPDCRANIDGLLSAWQPRRPTVLWLDDPEPGMLGSMLDALENAAASGRFRHSVRLFVTNQTMPEMSSRQGRNMPPPLASFALTARGFETEDIRILRQSMLPERLQRSLYRNADIESFLGATEGNPLLVAIGFDWIRDEQPLGDMSKAKLLDNRHQRIVEALRAAGIDMDDGETRRALACATLVGPGCPIGPLNDVFGQRIPIAGILARAFPVDAERGVDLARLAPNIRPSMLGDRFIREAIALQEPERSAERICKTGFRARPEGWLRAVERLGAEDDILGNALLVEPEISAGDIALRMAVAQAWVLRAAKGYADPQGVIAKVDALIEGVVDAHGKARLACELTSWFHHGIEGDWAGRLTLIEGRSSPEEDDSEFEEADLEPAYHRFFHGRAIALLGLSLIGAKTKWPFVPDSAVTSALSGTCDLATAVSRIGVSFWTSDDDKAAETLVSSALCLEPGQRLKSVPIEILRGVDARLREADWTPLTKAVRLGLFGLGCALDGDAATAFAERNGAEYIWDDPAACHARVNQVEEICGRLGSAADRDMQFDRARAWGCLASRLSDDPVACRDAVVRVEEIAGSTSYIADHDMQAALAVAWRHLASAFRNDPAACRDAVGRVEEIARQAAFAFHEEIQVEWAAAWGILAHALMNDLAACRDAVGRVEEIAGRPAYAASRNSLLQRARAWCAAAFVFKDNPVVCRDAANMVEQITSRPPFAADHAMQAQRGRAWCFLAFALRDDPIACRDATDRVEQIVGAPAFASDEEMQVERATASRILAYALKNEPALCREAVKRVEEIAQRPGVALNRDMQLERTTAWGFLAFALKDDPIACRQAVGKAEEIAGQPAYVADRDLQVRRAVAWRHLAFALRNDSAACRDAVRRVEEIAKQPAFASDEEIQSEAWFARNYLSSSINPSKPTPPPSAAPR